MLNEKISDKVYEIFKTLCLSEGNYLSELEFMDIVVEDLTAPV